MRGHVLLFLFFLVFGFLSSTDNFAVFCCAVVRCRWMLLPELKLWARITKRCRSQLVFLGSGDKIFLWRSALLVGGLGGQLAVDVPSSGRLWALLFILIFLFLFLDLFMGLDATEDLVWLPLSPYEVVVFPVVVVTHGPPEPRFESCSDDPWVVSSADIVLIWSERSIGKLYLFDSIGLQNFHQEFPVVFLLEFKIPFLVLWIGEILWELLDLLGQVLEAAQVLLVLWFGLLGWPPWLVNWLAIWPILYASLAIYSIWSCSTSILTICMRLLCLLGIVILLEVLFGHFSLYDHETCIDEWLFEQLTLEHAHQVLNTYVLTRWSLDDASVLLYLLLLSECLLRIGLALLLKGCLVLLQELCRLFESILWVLAIDAFVVEFGRWGLHLREDLQHVICIEFTSSYQGEEEGTMRCESAV